MGNEANRGLLITPLTLWALGIACALLSFIGITGLVKLDGELGVSPVGSTVKGRGGQWKKRRG